MLLIVIVASVYVPCGIFIRDTGCIVPMRCVSSIVAAEDITETEAPPEFVNVIELMVMANATSRSEGASPTLTCTVALFCANGCELDPPPHEASRMISIKTVKSVKVKRHVFVLSTCRRVLMLVLLHFSGLERVAIERVLADTGRVVRCQSVI